MWSHQNVWRDLVQSNYYFDLIEIGIGMKTICINIIFNNLNDLKCIDEKYYNSLSIVSSLQSLKLEFHTDNYIIKLFESFEYPHNLNAIEIMVDSRTGNKYSKHNSIKLNNLPEKLTKLKIISDGSFDLSNLPSQLTLLDLSETTCAFDLNYLPNSIKILHLPNLFISNSFSLDFAYELNDFMNLPSSLNEIHFGKNKDFVFNTTKDLIMFLTQQKFCEKNEKIL